LYAYAGDLRLPSGPHAVALVFINWQGSSDIGESSSNHRQIVKTFRSPSVQAAESGRGYVSPPPRFASCAPTPSVRRYWPTGEINRPDNGPGVSIPT